jgi:hypothetical protein
MHMQVAAVKGLLDSEKSCTHVRQVSHQAVAALSTRLKYCQALCKKKPSPTPAVAPGDASQEQPSGPPSPTAASSPPTHKGPGKVAAVLTAFHIITTVSVKSIDHSPSSPAGDLTDLCLPTTTSPPNTHLVTSAKFALSSALHRCFSPAPPPATTQQQGWQVPPAPYLPINYDGVSLANWASAMFCTKRHTRPPKAPAVHATRAVASSTEQCTTVFPASEVPSLQPHHLTSAQAPSMTATELVLVNKVLDAHLQDVTSCLFD